MISAKIIADSKAENGTRVTTFELEYPRFIHVEFMTHRMLSRNAASSRAIPLKNMLKLIRSEPAMPVEWGRNQAGMQAKEMLDPSEEFAAKLVWRLSGVVASGFAWMLGKIGVHKQIANRVVEPWSHIKVVATATDWDNFFHLRCHKDAQPEIHKLADLMWEAYEKSNPEELAVGEWHTPYVFHTRDADNTIKYFVLGEGDLPIYISKDEALKVSASCCAQVSYRRLDQSVEKAKKVYDKLVGSTPKHCFDGETQVLTDNGFKFFRDLNDKDAVAVFDPDDAKFVGFDSDYEYIEDDYQGDMYLYDQKDVSMMITPNHKIYGKRIQVSGDRQSEDYSLFPANGRNSPKAKYATYGESAIRIPTCSSGLKNESDYHGKSCLYFEGLVLGMFLGDGSLPRDYKNKVKFHLKKKRKIELLEYACSKLSEVVWSKNENADGSVTITIDPSKWFDPTRHYTSDRQKTLVPVGPCGEEPGLVLSAGSDQSYYDGIFDGLMNSDGSKKRSTYVYSTSSEVLKNQLEIFFPQYGFGSVMTSKSDDGNYRLYIRTKKSALVNDSRNDSRVEIIHYSGKIYCVGTSTGLIMAKRRGQTFLSGNSSPFEHQGTPLPFNITESGNFRGWKQHRFMIDGHVCREFVPHEEEEKVEDLTPADEETGSHNEVK